MSGLKSEFLFELTADKAEEQYYIDAPVGTRRIVPVTGGTFEGPKLRGTVLSGGGDWLLYGSDGAGRMDVRITLLTDDEQLIYSYYRGVFDCSPEVTQRMLRGEAVDPSEYYFRTAPVFETGSEKYGWLNRIVAVGVGTSTLTQVKYQVYVIL